MDDYRSGQTGAQLPTCVTRISRRYFACQGDAQRDACAVSRPAHEFDLALDLLHALPHIRQTVAGAAAFVHFKALAIVGDGDQQGICLHFHLQSHLSRAGMLDHVVQSFFHGEEQMVPGLGVQNLLRQNLWHGQPALDRRQFEEFQGKVTEVIGKSLQTVVSWIHCPHNLIHACN